MPDLTVQEPTTESANIMAVIARAASDPHTDVEKLERLADLYRSIRAEQAAQAFDAAMSDAQSEMRQIATDANNPQTKSRYASYAALDRAIRPIYTKHGFSLGFGTAEGAPPDYVRVRCRVSHRDGHRAVEHVDMPADGKGAKGGDVMTKTHATGAALTYGQRYLLKLIFNIAVGDDDDGNSNGGREQSAALEAGISSLNACNTSAELRTWKAGNAPMIQEMPTPEADTLVRLFNQRVRNLKEAGK